ncbi:MAG: hypothetical protein WC831_02985 [Parcubacteria group bacterium]|jgi:hypothetical protein
MKRKKKYFPESPKEMAHSYDPLEDIEREEGADLPEKIHEEAEKPIKLPKKIRSGAKESYFPLHRK